jgi:molybdenum cofactor cytidylyltransferase
VSDYGIILAAGASRRMGHPKALLEFGGRTLLEHALAAVEACGAVPLVVLGARAETIEERHPGLPHVVNPLWTQGMGTSIALAITLLPEQTQRAAILTVDQPNVGAAHLGRLFEACVDPWDAAATAYDGGLPGVPAVFHRRCFHRLASLEADEGARSLFRSSMIKSRVIDSAGTEDLDTPQAWERFIKDKQ